MASMAAWKQVTERERKMEIARQEDVQRRLRRKMRIHPRRAPGKLSRPVAAESLPEEPLR